MPIRKAEAEWKGNLLDGAGRLKVGSGAFEGPYSFKSRLEEGQSATNPEELIGAAHAGCFTMALTAQLSQKGITPNRIHTIAGVKLDKVGDAFAITRIELQTEAEISSIDDTTFQAIALDAKQNCPVSKALAGTEIHLTARLLNARQLSLSPHSHESSVWERWRWRCLGGRKLSDRRDREQSDLHCERLVVQDVNQPRCTGFSKDRSLRPNPSAGIVVSSFVAGQSGLPPSFL